MLDKTPFKFMGSQGVDFWIAKGRSELLSRMCVYAVSFFLFPLSIMVFAMICRTKRTCKVSGRNG